MTKININHAKAFLRHVKELENLGATNGIQAFEALSRLEKKAHKLAEDMCNFDIPEEIQDKRAEAIKSRVKKIFGGELPPGFFINYDPRGYALKIKSEQNKKWDDIPNNTDRIISFVDWGDYGILAPDFE